jgi:ferredoxin--NADP+ reductase
MGRACVLVRQSARDPVLEFYGVIVPEGPLSPRLARLRAGDALHIASNPAGFRAAEVRRAHLWLLDRHGTAPFLSILRTEAPWQRFRAPSGTRRAPCQRIDLSRHDFSLQKQEGPALRYVSLPLRRRLTRSPAASRRDRRRALAAAGARLSADTSQVLLCGNPDMLKDAGAAPRRARCARSPARPGHVTTESFGEALRAASPRPRRWFSGVRLAYDNADTFIRWRSLQFLDVQASRRTRSTSASPASCTGIARALPKYARDAEDAARRPSAGSPARTSFGGTMPSSGMAGRPCALPSTRRRRCSTD